MNEELKKRLIKFTNDVYYLQSDWADLGWNLSGDSGLDEDVCDDFENELIRLRDEAQEIQNLL